MIKLFIMASRSGTSLRSLSRVKHPKQFLHLLDKGTTLLSSLKRLKNLDVLSIIIIYNEKHRYIVAEQLRKINRLGSIILRPICRNTAPAIAFENPCKVYLKFKEVKPSSYFGENDIVRFQDRYARVQ